LHNKLKNIPDTNNVNEEWERMLKTISGAANEVIQTQGRTPRNERWDEECRDHIKKKNEARLNGSNKTQEQVKKHIGS